MKVEGYSKNRYLRYSSPLKHSPHFVNVSSYHCFAEYSGHQLLCRNSQPKNAHLQWNFLSSDEPKCPDGYFFISSGFLCRSFGQKEKCFPILIHHNPWSMVYYVIRTAACLRIPQPYGPTWHHLRSGSMSCPSSPRL